MTQSTAIAELPKARDYDAIPDTFRVLTEEKRKLILWHLQEGETRATACALARIRVGTLSRSIEVGERDLEDFELYGCPMTAQAQFVQDIHYAEALDRKKYRAKLSKIATDDPRQWTAEFAERERQKPMDYGRRSTVSVQQETAVKVVFEERGGNAWQGVKEQATIGFLQSGDIIETELSDEDG